MEDRKQGPVGSADLELIGQICGCYEGVNSSLTVGEAELTVRRTIASKRYVTVISYDRLSEVLLVHVPRASLTSFGYVVFRCEGDPPVPVDPEKIRTHRSAVVLSVPNEPVFYQLFCLLRAACKAAEFTVADIGEEPGAPVSARELEVLCRYYAPFRGRAADALRKEKKLGKDEAKRLVDRSWDLWQADAYEADPGKLLTDLDLVMGRPPRKMETTAEKTASTKVGSPVAAPMAEREAIRTADRMRCPVCGGQQIHMQRLRKRMMPPMRSGSPSVLGAITLAVRVVYLFLPRRIEFVCMSCGERWRK